MPNRAVKRLETYEVETKLELLLSIDTPVLRSTTLVNGVKESFPRLHFDFSRHSEARSCGRAACSHAWNAQPSHKGGSLHLIRCRLKVYMGKYEEDC